MHHATLGAGVLTVTVQYANGLKICDILGKQDPYVILRCGALAARTRTATFGGRSPVWHETFNFDIKPDITILDLELKDEDLIGSDHFIGKAAVNLAKVRASACGTDQVHAPVVRDTSLREYGFVALDLKFKSWEKVAAAPANAGHRPCGHRHRRTHSTGGDSLPESPQAPTQRPPRPAAA